MASKFNYTAFYYNEIKAALLRWRLSKAPKLSDTSEYALATQLENMMAVVLHLNNCNLDILAGESTIPTAQLLQSVINIGNTLGYPFTMYSPSTVTLVALLLQDVTVSTTIIPALSSYSADTPDGAVPFENLSAFKVTDSTSSLVYYYSYLQGDHYPFPFNTGCSVGDCIYLGFECMPSVLTFAITNPFTHSETGEWEYYDGLYKQWLTLTTVTDGTSMLTGDGEIDIVVPQSASRDWSQSEVNGITRYWLRFKLTAVDPSTVLPTVAVTPSQNYVKFTVTEGESVSETFVSDGSASQMFDLSSPGVVEGSLDTLTTDEGGTTVTWSRVTSLSLSEANDSEFRYVSDADGNMTIIFGDGVRGRIPPPGVTITVAYRVIPTGYSGNAPARSIDGETNGKLSNLNNYRAATGWKSAFDDIEYLRAAIPAWVREQLGAPSEAGLKHLLLTNALGTGGSPIERVAITNEGLSNGVIWACCVGDNGDAIDSSTLDSINEYFNDKDSGLIPPNHRLSCYNYTKHAFAVKAVVYGGDREEILTALVTAINPLATRTDSDGNTVYRWGFGNAPDESTRVSLSFITALIQDCSGVNRVALSYPDVDIQLANNELPYVDISGCYITVYPGD